MITRPGLFVGRAVPSSVLLYQQSSVLKQVDDVPCVQTFWIVHTDINTLRPRENGRHFADDIFKRIFFNENVWIPIKISLKFVPQGPINNIPALIQIMAWRRPGAKPLSGPMMVRAIGIYWSRVASRHLGPLLFTNMVVTLISVWKSYHTHFYVGRN